MTARPRSPLALRVQLALAALGAGPLLLAAAVLAWLLLWLGALPAAHQALQDAEAQLQRARAAVRPVAAPAAPPADALAAFRSRLADDDEVARLVQQVWRQAGAAGLRVSKVDWRAEAEPGQPFGRVRIVVPMSGSYVAMRRFAFGLLGDFPGLALDRLDLRREQAAAPVLDGSAHFTLYVKP